MRKIETLLELWEYRCEHYENGGLDRVIMDWQTTVKEKTTTLDPVINKDIAFAAESLLKPEPFTTKILHQLLLKQKDFRVKFLERIGFKTDLPDVRTEYHEKIKNYTNSYDISFWEDGKLVCIVENKLDADFSSEKEYTEAGKKIKKPHQLDRYCQALVDHNTEEPILVTLTKFDVHNKIDTVAEAYKTTVKFASLLWYDIVQDIKGLDVDSSANIDILKQAYDLFCYMNLNYEEFRHPYNPEKRKDIIDKLQKIIENCCGNDLLCHTSYPGKKGICNFVVYDKENSCRIQGGGSQQLYALPSINFEVRGYLLGSSHSDVLCEINANLLLEENETLRVSPNIYNAASSLDKSLVVAEEEFSRGIWSKIISFPGNAESEEKFYEEVEKLIKGAIEEFGKKIN